MPPKFEQPRVVGPLTWKGPLLGDDLSYPPHRSPTRPVKVTLIGPASLALRLVDEHYGDLASLALGHLGCAEPGDQGARGRSVSTSSSSTSPRSTSGTARCRTSPPEAIDRAFARRHSAQGSARLLRLRAQHRREARDARCTTSRSICSRSTSADAISLEYEQPHHSADLLEHTGDKTVVLGVLNLATDAPGRDRRPHRVAGQRRDRGRRTGPPAARTGLRHVVPPARDRPGEDLGPGAGGAAAPRQALLNQPHPARLVGTSRVTFWVRRRTGTCLTECQRAFRGQVARWQPARWSSTSPQACIAA